MASFLITKIGYFSDGACTIFNVAQHVYNEGPVGMHAVLILQEMCDSQDIRVLVRFSLIVCFLLCNLFHFMRDDVYQCECLTDIAYVNEQIFIIIYHYTLCPDKKWTPK